MAITPTGTIYKALYFDGVSSRDFGVYITGEAVYNAPKREVEMISIPGRNGDIALDKGRFENIPVTYPAGIFANNEEEFAKAISEFRNFLCSRKGYVRLTDEYNPDEYRMAVYKEGLEVDAKNLQAGEFTIIFTAKPQRYLTAGEEEIDVTDWSDVKTLSGETVTFEGNASMGFQSIKTVFNPSQDGTPWKSEVESAPYLFRQSSGGTVDHEYDSESDAIVGGTVAWNQLVQNGNFADTSNWNYTSGINFSVNNNIASVTCTSDGDRRLSQVIPFIIGHKYFVSVKAKSATADAITVQVYYGEPQNVVTYKPTDTNWHTFNAVVSCVSNTYNEFRFNNRTSGTTNEYQEAFIIDLTALFGSSTIADYLYSLEQTTAGSGIAKLKEWGFDIDSYHAYDAGSLQSVNTSAHITTTDTPAGINLMPPSVAKTETVNGVTFATNGNGVYTIKGTATATAVVEFPLTETFTIPDGQTHKVWFMNSVGFNGNFKFYNGSTEVDSWNLQTQYRSTNYAGMSGKTCNRIALVVNAGVTIDCQLSPMFLANGVDGSTFIPYYTTYTYPLDSDLVLRGIPKLDEYGNLRYDGDIYAPSGEVTRKYGIVDLGSLNWLDIGDGYWYQKTIMSDVKPVPNSAYANCMCPIYTVDTADNINFKRHDKVIGINSEGRIASNDSGNYADASAYKAAMSGVYLVYELKTETIETADPYTAIQDVSPYGTEEYIDYGVSQGTRDIAVPVGHQTRYIKRVPINKLDKIITYVSPTDDEEDATTYETALGSSDYGGMVDVITGEFAKFWTGEIYTGQALGIAWFSDCDAFGTQPTYGAYVVTTTMEEEQLTGQDVQILNGRNVIWTNGDAHQLYPFPYDKFVEVTYGVEPGKIYNPTLFDAQPLLKAKGEGSIFIGAKEVEILDLDFGDVELIPGGSGSGWIPFNKTNYDLMNLGDTITIPAGSTFPIGIDTHGVPINSLTITVNHSDYQCTLWNMHAEDAPDKWWFNFSIDETITLEKKSTAGTSLQTSFGFSVSFGSQSISAGILGEIKYYPNNNGVAGIDFSPAKEFSSAMSDISLYTPSNYAERKAVSGYSTKPVSGGDYVYIDCELGEAYIFNEGEPVLLNRYIDLGSELPVLKPGVTEITKDDTITDLVVEPHWWKI